MSLPPPSALFHAAPPRTVQGSEPLGQEAPWTSFAVPPPRSTRGGTLALGPGPAEQ